MLSQIGQKPPSDFADPLGMLEDCHRRILFFLKTLAEVAATPEGRALTGVRMDALETALRYFRGRPRTTTLMRKHRSSPGSGG